MTTNNYEVLASTALGILKLKFTDQLVNEGCSQELASEFFEWYVDHTNFKQLYEQAFTEQFTPDEIEDIVGYQNKYLQRMLSLDTELTTKTLFNVSPDMVQNKLEELLEKYNVI
jgi:hypothetical protein